MIKKIFITCFLCATCAAAELPLDAKFVQAEIQVESGGKDNALGDKGAAIGCLEIHKSCWLDAIRFNPSLHGNYTNCFNRSYSVQTMTAYLNHYCPAAVKSNDFKTLSRVWNGGPKGANNPNTLGYWTKIKKQLDKLK